MGNLPSADTAALAQLAILVAFLVQIIKPAISDGPNQNNVLRAISVALGGLLVPAYVLSRTGTVLSPQIVVDALLAGIALGAGTTLAAAAAIAVNQPSVTTVGEPLKPAPTETPPAA